MNFKKACIVALFALSTLSLCNCAHTSNVGSPPPAKYCLNAAVISPEGEVIPMEEVNQMAVCYSTEGECLDVKRDMRRGWIEGDFTETVCYANGWRLRQTCLPVYK